MMSFIKYGMFPMPWWGYIIVTLVVTQITVFSVTIYLHRCQSHRALDLHPMVSHFFRFWIWLTTGMITKEWAAIHRKHHARVEMGDDPHSPQVKGLAAVMLRGNELYRKERCNQDTLNRYGEGTPDDWIEHQLYTKHSMLGIMIMLMLNVLFFGPIGMTIWAAQMAWIPIFGGVINGIGHFGGYRNYECADASRNIYPLAILIGGEELHNNHHTFGTSAKFSVKWWEVDIGWFLIRMLQIFKLAKPKRTPPKVKTSPGKSAVDSDTIRAIITYRFQVMSRYGKEVIFPVLRDEYQRTNIMSKTLLRRVQKLLIRDSSLINPENKKQLETELQKYQSLQIVYQLRLKLQNIWSRSTATQKELIEALQEWCQQAEATGIEYLCQFVRQIKTYVPQHA